MEVREDDESFRNPIDWLFVVLEESEPQHFAVRQYRKFKLAAGVIKSNRRFNQRQIFNITQAVTAFAAQTDGHHATYYTPNNRRERRNYAHRLHQSGRLLVTRNHTQRTKKRTNNRQIRTNAQRVPAEKKIRAVFSTFADRTVISALS
jgi:hypothetical protein